MLFECLMTYIVFKLKILIFRDFKTLKLSLITEFQLRFTDFSNSFNEMKLFADPFGTDVVAPEIFQMDLI